MRFLRILAVLLCACQVHAKAVFAHILVRALFISDSPDYSSYIYYYERRWFNMYYLGSYMILCSALPL